MDHICYKVFMIVIDFLPDNYNKWNRETRIIANLPRLMKTVFELDFLDQLSGMKVFEELRAKESFKKVIEFAVLKGIAIRRKFSLTRRFAGLRFIAFLYCLFYWWSFKKFEKMKIFYPVLKMNSVCPIDYIVKKQAWLHVKP